MTVGRLKAKLFIFLTVVVVLVITTLASGNQPLLGLDLQGGISIVYEPVGKSTSDGLNVAVDIIRSRVDGLGVAEPEISRQGSNIVVDLPGVANRDKARRIVGKTAELRFRPVLAQVPLAEKVTPTTTTTVPGATPTTGDPSTTPTTIPAGESADAAAQAVIATCDPTAISALDRIPTTSRADDKRDSCVVLPFRSEDKQAEQYRLLLGPTAMTGDQVSGAKKRFQNQYVVLLDLTSDGLKKFNDLAQSSFGQPSPQNEVAIVLDGSSPVEPRVPGADVRRHGADHGQLQLARRRRPREHHQVRPAAGGAQGAHGAERVADAGQGPAASRDHRRRDRPDPGRRSTCSSTTGSSGWS